MKECKKTLTTNVNIIEAYLKKEYLYIIYYNSNKKNYYLKFCFKLPKN